MKPLKMFPVQPLLAKSVTAFLIIQSFIWQVGFTQLPDCFTGTKMYGIFTPTAPAPGSDSTELRSIDFATGAVGGLMGGKRYYIVKNFGGSNFYGSSAMAMSCITNQFYAFTQMGTSSTTRGDKDIIAINTLIPGTMTTIGTTPSTYRDYHIVKAAIAPNGWGYAVGVHRTSTAPSSTFNPLFRFKVCTTAGCANGAGNFDLLGYIADTGIAATMNLFNGDIVFDNSGNLYFMAAAYSTTISKYTDARLFKIKATDIPASAGAGSIPISFIADFNGIDSTGVSGIAVDPGGSFYISTRRYANNNPAQPYVTELYSSFDTATTTLIPGFNPPANTSVGDLASGYFAAGILAKNDVLLSCSKAGEKVSLNWKVSNNPEVNYFEIQRSTDGSRFETIASQPAINSNISDAEYHFGDENTPSSKYVFYRIRQVMKQGSLRYYSNVVKVTLDGALSISGRFTPNPFVDQFEVNADLRSGGEIIISLRDQSGRVVRQTQMAGVIGKNRLVMNGLSSLSRGIYIAEIRAGNDVIREKLSKQ